MSVQFPVVLALSALIGAAWALQGHERWAWLCRVAAIAAAVAAALAATTGLASAGHVIDMGGDPRLIAKHRNLALGATAFLAISALILGLGLAKRRALGLIGAAIAAVAVSAAAHFGGDMLHPGLAPWSEAPHHHGPSPAASRPSTVAPSAMPVSAAAPPNVSSTVPEPSSSAKPAHDHSGHKH